MLCCSMLCCYTMLCYVTPSAIKYAVTFITFLHYALLVNPILYCNTTNLCTAIFGLEHLCEQVVARHLTSRVFEKKIVFNRVA